MSKEIIQTDVLVIGAGVAGLFAAIRAKEAGVDVVVVDKSQSSFSGASAYGAQQIRVMFPSDNLDDYAKESIVWSDYLADQDICYAVVGESYDRFQDLLNWGVEFMKDDKGEIKTLVSDKPYSTELKTRYVYPTPPGTSIHKRKMKAEALRLGVKFIDRVITTDLLTSNSKLAGAVGFGIRDGEFYRFDAKAVVIATGTFYFPPGHIYYPGPAGMTMALRAGAELINMEQGKGFNIGLFGGQFNSFSPYWFDGEEDWGQKIVNAKGEEFMEQYELTKRLPGRRHWGPPWRLLIPAIVREWREGKGPCYMDLSGCPNYWQRLSEYYRGHIDEFVREWDFLAEKRGGLPLNEFWRIPFELVPGLGYEAGGGIRVNVNSETRVPGLYAAGIVTDTAGGAGYTNAGSFTACFTQGHRAGKNAAEYAKLQPKPVVNEKQVKELEHTVSSPLERTEGITPDDLLEKLAVISYKYTDVIKNEARLTKGIEEIERLKIEAENLVAKDAHYLGKCIDAKSIVELYNIMAKTSLMRTESRGNHYREDYPLMDNDEWLKWLVVKLKEGKAKITPEDIPFKEKNWKYQPEPGKINIWRRVE